jgi:RecJ-like exonuclease
MSSLIGNKICYTCGGVGQEKVIVRMQCIHDNDSKNPWSRCSICQGSGSMNCTVNKTCRSCDGSGKVY